MNLTNKHREDIISTCIKATFGKRNEAYEAMRAELAEAIYKEKYGAHEANAKKLPDGWLDTTSHMKITMPGFSYNSKTDGRCSDDLVMKNQRRVPRYGRHALTIAEGDSLHVMAKAVLDEFEKIKAEESELSSNLRGVVYACTTREKLLQSWPEGESFFPALVARQTAIIPVALAQAVNKIMGLSAK